MPGVDGHHHQPRAGRRIDDRRHRRRRRLPLPVAGAGHLHGQDRAAGISDASPRERRGAGRTDDAGRARDEGRARCRETVTVTGASPTVDTTSATVNVTLSEELLQATPGGRDIWALTEYKVPGLVMSRPDVGGTSGGLQGTYSARGTTSAQNTQYLNGVNVGDPAAIGAAGFYYDFDAFDDIQVSAGAHDITVPTSRRVPEHDHQERRQQVGRPGGVLLRGQADCRAATSIRRCRTTASTRSPAPSTSSRTARSTSADRSADKAAVLHVVPRLARARQHAGGAVGDARRSDQHDVGPGQRHLSAEQNNTFKAFYTRQSYKKPNRFLTSATVPSTNFDSRLGVERGRRVRRRPGAVELGASRSVCS